MIHRGRLFVAREEDLMAWTERGGTMTVEHRKALRPVRRRSWTEEAMREAVAWVFSKGEDDRDYLILGPDGTKAMAERVVAELKAA